MLSTITPEVANPLTALRHRTRPPTLARPRRNHRRPTRKHARAQRPRSARRPQHSQIRLHHIHAAIHGRKQRQRSCKRRIINRLSSTFNITFTLEYRHRGEIGYHIAPTLFVFPQSAFCMDRLHRRLAVRIPPFVSRLSQRACVPVESCHVLSCPDIVLLGLDVCIQHRCLVA